MPLQTSSQRYQYRRSAFALLLAVTLLALPRESVADALTAFRVRSGFEAPLNADDGWAGATNENVTVTADQPFRLRFEVEGAGESPTARGFRLQYRRNGGDWTDAEAHDFPYPQRDLEVDFDGEGAEGVPPGWKIAGGEPADMALTSEDGETFLRVGPRTETLAALYETPWEPVEFAARFDIGPFAPLGVRFLFAYVDAENHGRIHVDPAGALRISRLADGRETILAEEAVVVLGAKWLELEFEIDGSTIEVNFDDDRLEMEADFGAPIPLTALGFSVPGGINSQVDFREFSFQGLAGAPRASIVKCPALEAAGGISLSERTPPWADGATEAVFEWPLVIRRFADGPLVNEPGDRFAFRMVDGQGTPLKGVAGPILTLEVPPGHLGGTYVETPGRIGPWQASNGDLYFIMEPTETDNVFMMVKSEDRGQTWREVDGANRPGTDDLESVDSRLVGDTIHIIHQVTRSTRYHAFRTSDHPTSPDTWAVRDEVAGTVDAVAQMASMVVRPDGSVVAFYLGQNRIHYSVRDPRDGWGAGGRIDDIPFSQSGPQAVLGADGVVHIAYCGTNGTIRYRRMLADGALTPMQQLAEGAGTSRAEYGAVLPLVYLPAKDQVVIVYRLEDGTLWERRASNEGLLLDPRQVTDVPVITDAVDSQQPAADVVADGETVHVTFVDESSRSIHHTQDADGWHPPAVVVDGIRGSWIRGNVYPGPDGARVYGVVYDAGSEGGAGMNRYVEIALTGE